MSEENKYTPSEIAYLLRTPEMHDDIKKVPTSIELTDFISSYYNEIYSAYAALQALQKFISDNKVALHD